MSKEYEINTANLAGIAKNSYKFTEELTEVPSGLVSGSVDVVNAYFSVSDVVFGKLHHTKHQKREKQLIIR